MTALLEPNSSALPDPSPSPTDWRTHLTDELKADPVVSSWAEKASEKDIPSLVKGYAHLSKRMGSAVNIPGKDAKPEDVTAFKAKLIEAGMLPTPITDPKEYAITRPKDLPAGIPWSEELSGKLAATMQKYQVPKEMVPELMALHMEALGGVSQALKFDLEKGMTALRAEYGDKFDERVEMADRIGAGIFSPESMQFFEQTGINKDPRFLSAILRIAPAFVQDSSFMESIPNQGGEMTGEAAKEEHNKVMTDPAHPMYAGYRQVPMDPKAKAYVDGLYRKAYGYQKEA